MGQVGMAASILRRRRDNTKGRCGAGIKIEDLHGRQAAAALAGLALFSVAAAAQEFELVETPSVTKLPVAQLKPKSIVFSDQPGEGLVDPAVGFVTPRGLGEGEAA